MLPTVHGLTGSAEMTQELYSTAMRKEDFQR